jgi:hydrogenase nickel incorporation protein HypA/HybF
MHEMGIASSILDSVRSEAEKKPGMRVLSLGLRIGELSGVSPESLEFCLQCLVKDTEFDGLGIEIERTPRRHRCPKCNREFDVIDYEVVCPGCGEFGTQLVSGDELEIAYLEVEDT